MCQNFMPPYSNKILLPDKEFRIASMDDSAKRILTQFEALFTVIACATQDRFETLLMSIGLKSNARAL